MEIGDHIEAVVAGDRRALAKAITLIESRRPEDREAGQTLLGGLLPHTGGAIRVGVSGVPGVGKSTLIEALGLHLTERGQRVAVLAVDPSSRRSGGSIMGDKTRMERLAADARAFIRPSPTGGTLGGVARRTREALLVCEAAGFDVVLVETVGVGQSETAVADMVDFFALLILPGAGDELQGIKRGIVELADAVVVNKADQDPDLAARAAHEYGMALHLLTPSGEIWSPTVLQISALRATGIAEVWETVLAHRDTLGAQRMAQRRRDQAGRWFYSLVEDELWQRLLATPGARRRLKSLEQRVRVGSLAPTKAADQLLAELAPRP